ncbi:MULTISPECIES: helix-turn-helix domain-containing protein [Actinoalloteichus]|uniref:helix-turn-helix domain-containing protein n=1 Tax=Actinoalloteichus TaxID=65496 RepID=UPI0009511534|nr:MULTISPECIES: helix-turn-helix transcriptional regulator [Actinoalloteichus]
MDVQDALIGHRIREVRRWRRLNLTVTAELAGMSAGYLSRLERGERTVNRRSILEALAQALRVSPTDLTGQPYEPTDPVSSEAHAALARMEIVLGELDLGTDPGVRARPWAQIEKSVDHLNTVLRRDADYAGQGQLVPGLLTELHAAYVQQPEHRGDILVGLLHAYHSAAVLTKNLGVRGLPILAARLAEGCARELGRPEWTAFASWLRSHAAGSLGRARQYEMSVRAVDAVVVRDANAVQISGMLHLNAALAAAAQQKADVVSTHLDEAAALAGRLPEGAENFGFLYFGSDNVGIWRVSLMTELGAGGKVAELARGVHPAALPARARQCMYWTDLGRALITERATRDEGIRALRRAEEIAPQRVRNNPFVREAVSGLLRSSRSEAGRRELRGLAWRMGVAPTQ